MKKTRFLALLFTLTSTIALFSQEFAPIGTKWTYEFFHSSIWGLPSLWYGNEYLSAHDTVLLGQRVRGITNYGGVCWIRNASDMDYLYVYNSGDTVYYYNPYRRAFLRLYDWTWEVGDTIVWPAMGYLPDTNAFEATVERIHLDTNNCSQIRRVWLLNSYNGSYYFYAIEDVGFANHLLPVVAPDHCEGSFIRCYSDPNLECKWVNYDCDLTIDRSFGLATTIWEHCVSPQIGSNKILEVRTSNTEREQKWGTICNTFEVSAYDGFPMLDSFVICSEIYDFLDYGRTYYRIGNDYHLLHDFELGPGDEYTIRYPKELDERNPDIDSITIHIDSVSNTEPKRLYISYDAPVDLGRYMTVGEGFETWILPIYNEHIGEEHIFNGLLVHKTPLREYKNRDLECIDVGNKEENQSSISVYPNPTSSFITITGLDDIEYFEVWDIQGRMVMAGARYDRVDLRDIESGHYLIAVQVGNTRYSTRLVKI